jgi:Cu(I)/Ag(I) efflux system membrane fusion protein
MKIKSKIVFLSFCALILACNNGKESNSGHENHSNQQKQKIYTCPMHPQIIKDAPGQCPICGMNLVEKKNEGAAIQNDTLKILLKPTNEYVISTVKTIHPQNKEISLEVEASGKITYDTREVNVVSARVSGRIEKLYVKSRYQLISKGQKLMDIYSKELLTEQENYIYLLNNDADNLSLIKAAESRLLLNGFSSEQLKELKRMQKPFQSVTIYSPYTGHLHDLVNSNTVSDMSKMTESSSQELTVKEGMYVDKGQSIFNIYNTAKVWAILTIYTDGVDMVRVGQKVTLLLDAQDSLKIEGRIDFIEPFISNDQNTTQVRVYFNNKNNEFKVGTILKAKIEAGSKNGTFIPSTAIINLGSRDVVFVKEKNIFKAKQVAIGIKTDLHTEITSGITDADSIAENAQLLMDSESFIKVETRQHE